MDPQLLLGGIVLLPVVLLLFFRVNATLVFLSLCLGAVLVQFVAGDTTAFIDFLSDETNEQVTQDAIKIGLLLLPVILTTVFMIRTVKGRTKLFLNVLPAVGVGLLGALLIVPLLPPDLSDEIVHSPLWSEVERSQSLIVGASAMVCLFVLWLQRPKTGHDDKHGKHKG